MSRPGRTGIGREEGTIGNPLKRLPEFWHHFLRFGIAGIGVAGIQSGGYALLVQLGWVEPIIANAIAFVVATAVSFAVHFSWTFRSARAPWRAAWRFGVGKLVGLGINTGAVYLVHHVWGRDPLWALPVMMIVTPLTVFAISKYWAFRDPNHYEGGGREDEASGEAAR